MLTSCQLFNNQEGEGAIARVGEQYLYLEDIDGLASANDEDSAKIVKAYIDNWVKEQLLLRKALQNLPDNEVNFEKQLENYRRSLIIYAYENQILRQKLDTLVTEDQVEVYYRNNIENFELKEDVLQLRMVMMRPSAPNQDSLNYWLFERDSLLLTKLVDYCTGIAEKCVIDTSEWVSLNLLNSYLPKKVELSELGVGKNIIEDSLRVVYIDLFNKRQKGEIAPVNFVQDQIRSIIKNQRRLKLLAEVRKQIFEDAGLKNTYEVY
jgi:hypothetical protein